MTKPLLDKLILACLLLFSGSIVFSVTGAEVALFAVLALLLTKYYSSGEFPSMLPGLKAHTLFLPWAVYLGVCLLTALTAYYPLKGLGQLNSDFLKYICLSTLLLTVRKDYLPKLAAAYTATAMVSAIIGIDQVAYSIMNHVTPIKRASAFMNAVRYGEIMAIAGAFLMAKTLCQKAADPLKERLFYSAGAILVFAAIVLSRTRGAYLGFVVGFAALFVFARGLRLKTLALTAALVATGLATAYFNPAIGTRFALTQKTAAAAPVIEEAVNIRLELWQLGWKVFKTHPVLGIGPDNMKPKFRDFKPDLVFDAVWGSLHSLYIHQAAERGLLGLAALLFLFGSFLLLAVRNLKKELNPYTLWAACVLPAYYAMNLTEISFQHVHTSFAVFLALAASSASVSDTAPGQ